MGGLLMARFAVVRNGVVANVVEAENEQACAHLAPVVAAPDAVAGGWLHDGSDFSPPEPTIMVPEVVTPFQARAALRAAGLLSQVEAIVEAADDITKDAWEYATEFRRTSPLLNSLAVQLFGEEAAQGQLDVLFIAAGSIEV